MNSKGELRVAIKSQLKKISEDEWRILSRQVSQNLLRLIHNLLSDKKIHRLNFIGGFAPLVNEVNWMVALQTYSDQFAFPAIEQNKMVFKKSTYSELKTSKEFGVEIKTPEASSQIIDSEILIIPGLGFDLKLNRLGRGAGFYDRYLENFKGLKIGVCLEAQLIDEVPCEEHDQKIDYLVTENKVYGSDSREL